MGCPNMRFWAELVNEDRVTHKSVKLPCRRWSCPECSKDNARRLRLAVRAGVSAWMSENDVTEAKLGYQVKLLTLTLPGGEWRESRSLAEMEKVSKHRLNNFLQMLRKHRGLDAYCWVREVKGEKHLHYHVLVIGPGISDRDVLPFVRGLWSGRYGMGNVDVQVVRTLQGAVTYVTKYLTKGEHESKLAHGKHFGMSRSIRSQVKVERDKRRMEWTVLKVGVLNSDSSFGKVLWEAPQVLDMESSWVREVLTPSDGFLSFGIISKGKQLKLFEY